MIITNDTIQFKTIDRLFEKEKSGIKNNSVRKITGNEWIIFVENLRFLKVIKITTVDLCDCFEREIRDISILDDLVIFTWNQ